MSGPDHGLTVVPDYPLIRGPVFTLTEAQERTGVSRSTLRRRLKDGKFPHAYKAGPDQEWYLTIADLIGAGFQVNTPDPGHDEPVSAPTDRAADQGEQPDPGLRNRVVQLERDLAHERELRRAVEGHVEDLRRALLMLEARPQQPEPAPQLRVYEPVVEPDEQPRTRRKWWGRRT